MRVFLPRQVLPSALLAAAVALSLSGCSRGPGAPRDSRPNVLIVAVDAMRADRLGCYGYPRPTTPNIDALAGEADTVVFRSHYAQGANTKTSTASLFSGLFCFQHGVSWSTEMRASGDGPNRYATQVLGEDLRTLAERMREGGFRTFAVVKSRHLMPEFGFSQGFDDYVTAREVDSDARRVERTLELAQRGSGRPFFGYVHLAGVHHPFPEAGRHPAILEAYGFDYDEAARKAAGVDFTVPETKFAINERGLELLPEDVRFLDLIYDAELRTVDEEYVGKLLQGLREQGSYDDTLLIVTADHGEELYDHGGYAHGHALWDEVVHVPLVVKFPAGRRPERLDRRVEEPTQTIDLVPSLLDFVGEPPPTDLPGTDVFLGDPRGSVLSEIPGGFMLLLDGYKLIDSADHTWLVDHRNDPQERNDLAEAEPERVAAMRRAADALRQLAGSGPGEAAVIETDLDPEAIEALKSLGYLK